MAESPAHRLGNMIGNFLEDAVEPILREFAEQYMLYLDKKGPRVARGRGKKVSWIDMYGNKHDLDFVLEKGGTDESIGTPVAFIEVAWRRYTKHSRNKAQEIQSAILPLVEKYRHFAPFKGVVLGGEFTDGAITQLSSREFNVLYFDYNSIVEAFQSQDVDISSEENTSEEDLQRKIENFNNLSAQQLEDIRDMLFELNREHITEFMEKLTSCITRQVERVIILPLYGSKVMQPSIYDAIKYIHNYNIEQSPEKGNFIRYEVSVEFSNGDLIDGKFKEKESAIQFLSNYQIPSFIPDIVS